MPCSFCGKNEDETARLIAGPGELRICSECVHLCAEIINEDPPAPSVVQETMLVLEDGRAMSSPAVCMRPSRSSEPVMSESLRSRSWPVVALPYAGRLFASFSLSRIPKWSHPLARSGRGR